MRSLHVVVDLQFGSCGKGLFCGYLAETTKPDCVVSAWAPNAGHTYINADGRKDVRCMLPIGAVSPELKTILLGPGSVINPEILEAEINEWHETHRFGEHGADVVRIAIHESAVVVNERHRVAERAYGTRIGSTMKGVGEATIGKIRRMPDVLTVAKDVLAGTQLEQYVVSHVRYEELLDAAEVVLVEGAQGYSLGINSGFWPYCTSRECTTHQVLSDCGIPHLWKKDTYVYGVARTHPIRVSNRFAPNGDMIGTSGPCYPDQHELRWEQDLKREPELTTVTKLPRRIFTFSREQVRQAIRMNGVDAVFLNFANYLQPKGVIYAASELAEIMHMIDDAMAPVKWLGWGPTFNDVEAI